MRLACLLLALLAAAAAPAAAGAAEPWSPPVPVPGTETGSPDLAFTAGGRGLVAYTRGGGLGQALEVHGAWSTNDVFEPARVVGEFGLVSLGAYGRDRVIAFGRTGQRHPRAVVAFARAGQPFGAPRQLWRGHDATIVATAVNERGDAAVVLIPCTRGACGRGIPYLVVRRAGGPFRAPVRLASRGPTIDAAVAVNAAGDVLAAWERPVTGTTGPRAIYARTRIAGSGRLGAPRRLGSAVPSVSLSAALGDGRRAVVAWLGQGVSEGDAGTPATIRVAAAAPHHSFGAAWTVEVVPVTGAGRYVSAPGVQAAIAPDDRAVVAWTGYENDRFVARTAPVTGSRVGTPQIVSDPAQDTVLAGLATGPGGALAVLGRQGIRGADPATPDAQIALVGAARAPRATTFGPTELIAGPGPLIATAALAFDPASSRAVAAWADLGASAVSVSVRAPLAGG